MKDPIMTDFTATRAAFHLPEGMIYLDGNSLGPLPKSAAARVAQTVTDEWGDHLITGWNACGWMDMPARLGDRIGRLIGAEPGHVVVGDTLSIKVFQALAAALKLNPDRRVILSDTGNFPSDLYMAEGLISLLGPDYELRLVAPEEVEAALTDEIAVSMITEVDYRTGRKHDMAALTAKAHEHGVVTVWDLAHSAGAIPVDLAGAKADFAVGCTYKYLNGAPARLPSSMSRPAMPTWRCPRCRDGWGMTAPLPSTLATNRVRAFPGCGSAHPLSCRWRPWTRRLTCGTTLTCRICARGPSTFPNGSSPGSRPPARI
jgi:kynureninase